MTILYRILIILIEVVALLTILYFLIKFFGFFYNYGRPMSKKSQNELHKRLHKYKLIPYDVLVHSSHNYERISRISSRIFPFRAVDKHLKRGLVFYRSPLAKRIERIFKTLNDELEQEKYTKLTEESNRKRIQTNQRKKGI